MCRVCWYPFLKYRQEYRKKIFLSFVSLDIWRNISTIASSFMFTSLSNLTDSKLFIAFARIFGGILSRNNFSLKEQERDLSFVCLDISMNISLSTRMHEENSAVDGRRNDEGEMNIIKLKSFDVASRNLLEKLPQLGSSQIVMPVSVNYCCLGSSNNISKKIFNASWRKLFKFILSKLIFIIASSNVFILSLV